MSRWLPDATVYALGEHCLLQADVGRGDAGSLVRSRMLAWHADMPPARRTQVFQDGLTELQQSSANPRARRRVMVADAWARYWVMQAPTSVRSLAELRAVARARCQQLLGHAQDWELLADWRPSGRFLCVALPAWLTVTVREACGPSVAIDTPVLRLLRDGPTWLREKSGWAAVASARRLVLLGWSQGRPTEIRSLAVEESCDEVDRMHQAAREIRRMQLRGVAPHAEGGSWWSWSPVAARTTRESLGNWTFTVRTPRYATLTPAAGAEGEALDAEAVDALRAACCDMSENVGS